MNVPPPPEAVELNQFLWITKCNTDNQPVVSQSQGERLKPELISACMVDEASCTAEQEGIVEQIRATI